MIHHYNPACSMLPELKQDLLLLHERQEQIIQLFGHITHKKYQINSNSNKQKNNKSAVAGKPSTAGKNNNGEVFIDTKWKPLVAAHENMQKSFVKIQRNTPKTYYNIHPPTTSPNSSRGGNKPIPSLAETVPQPLAAGITTNNKPQAHSPKRRGTNRIKSGEQTSDDVDIELLLEDNDEVRAFPSFYILMFFLG